MPFSRIAERRIKEAMSRGEFENLPGAGKPLDLEDYFYNGNFGGGDEFQNDIVASLGLAIGLGGKAD